MGEFGREKSLPIFYRFCRERDIYYMKNNLTFFKKNLVFSKKEYIFAIGWLVMNDEQRRKLYEEVRLLHDPKYLEQQRREKTMKSCETYFRRREIEKARQEKIRAQKQAIWDEVRRLRAEIKWREEWRRQMVEKMKQKDIEEWLFNSLSHLEDRMWAEIGEIEEMIEMEKEKLKTI